MYGILKKGYIIGAWLYGSFVFSWLALHTLFGDQIWWLALLNVFAPYFFLPLLPLLVVSAYYRTATIYLPVISVALTFFALYGQQLPFHRLLLPSVINEPTIRIMSFNIWSGSRREETANVIRANHWPDIVAIQELTPTMATLIDEAVGEQYPFRILDFKDGRVGLGIYSCYPLQELNPEIGSDPNWQVQVVQVQMPDRSFVLYNVHPYATNVYLYLEQGLSLSNAVRTSYANRLTFVNRLLDDIQQRDTPVIVAGDLNSTEQSDVYKVLTASLADAYRVAGQGFGHTFPVYSASFQEIPPLAKLAQFVSAKTPNFVPRYYLNSFRLLRIDMILYSREVSAIKSHVSSIHGESDHLPVLATMQWRW